MKKREGCFFTALASCVTGRHIDRPYDLFDDDVDLLGEVGAGLQGRASRYARRLSSTYRGRQRRRPRSAVALTAAPMAAFLIFVGGLEVVQRFEGGGEISRRITVGREGRGIDSALRGQIGHALPGR